MAAKGADVSETYLKKMLKHHRGAVALSDVVLAKGATGPVKTAAQKIKSDQTKEVAMIERMLAGETMSMAPQVTETPQATVAKPVAKTSPAPTRADSGCQGFPETRCEGGADAGAHGDSLGRSACGHEDVAQTTDPSPALAAGFHRFGARGSVVRAPPLGRYKDF